MGIEERLQRLEDDRAIRDLKAATGRFTLVGVVIALVALMGVLLSGLATGLVDDGISGLRAQRFTLDLTP